MIKKTIHFGYWQKTKYLKYSYEKIFEKIKFKKNISLKNFIPKNMVILNLSGFIFEVVTI